MSYEYIINPITSENVILSSTQGKYLLGQYIKTYQDGGKPCSKCKEQQGSNLYSSKTKRTCSTHGSKRKKWRCRLCSEVPRKGILSGKCCPRCKRTRRQASALVRTLNRDHGKYLEKLNYDMESEKKVIDTAHKMPEGESWQNGRIRRNSKATEMKILKAKYDRLFKQAKIRNLGGINENRTRTSLDKVALCNGHGNQLPEVTKTVQDDDDTGLGARGGETEDGTDGDDDETKGETKGETNGGTDDWTYGDDDETNM